jgi:hypothetical protein
MPAKRPIETAGSSSVSAARRVGSSKTLSYRFVPSNHVILADVLIAASGTNRLLDPLQGWIERDSVAVLHLMQILGELLFAQIEGVIDRSQHGAKIDDANWNVWRKMVFCQLRPEYLDNPTNELGISVLPQH